MLNREKLRTFFKLHFEKNFFKSLTVGEGVCRNFNRKCCVLTTESELYVCFSILKRVKSG